jgi:ankyrin repeat protein
MSYLTKCLLCIVAIQLCNMSDKAQGGVTKSRPVSSQNSKDKIESKKELICPLDNDVNGGVLAPDSKVIDVDTVNKKGCTALMRGAENGEVQTVRTLLKQGATVEAKLPSGHTALILAAKEGQLEIVTLLLGYGANANASIYGPHTGEATVLVFDIGSGQKAVVEAMIDAGAEVNPADFVGATPLEFAIGYTHDSKIVKTLLERGADVNLGNYFGFTPLMEASADESVEFIKILLAAGADVNRQMDEGTTALMIAASSGSPEGVEVLIAAGANVHAKNKLGETASSLALKSKREDNLAVLKRVKAK